MSLIEISKLGPGLIEYLTDSEPEAPYNGHNVLRYKIHNLEMDYNGVYF